MTRYVVNPNKEVAKNVIVAYLASGDTSEGIAELCEIKFGNDELLLEHIKALRNIFENAIKEMSMVKKEYIEDDIR